MINTKRFYLRKFKLSDAESMYNNWASDPLVTKYLTWQPHKDLSVSKEYIKYLIDTNKSDFAICDRITDEVIGSIANVGENADFSVCEVGYCLSRKYWNQGVMTEILDAYLDDLFNNKNYMVVEAEHMIENIASGAVMVKCGFRYNYTAEKLDNKNGWINVKHYSITKEEYLMHKLQQLVNLQLDIANIKEVIDDCKDKINATTIPNKNQIFLVMDNLYYKLSQKCEKLTQKIKLKSSSRFTLY